ncbi:MAG TPA: TMEM175 family protein [Dehalococcoidia bacterium]|nr:TMEM175 family protein [Dehalococcoidia bacterium]
MQQDDLPEAEDAPANDRIQALSDGVFAFAMTLLVLGILVPNPSEVPSNQLARHVLAQRPSFFVWVLSFLVIGSFWSAHHRLFRELRSHDDRLIVLNLIVLLFVAFMPYPTALIGRYSHSQFAVVLYAGSMFLTSSALSLISFHTLRVPALARSEAARARIKAGLWRGLSLQAICIISVAVSFLSLSAAMLCWALIPFARRVVTARLSVLPRRVRLGGRR